MTGNGKMSETAAAEPVREAYMTFLPGADDGERLEAVVLLAEDLCMVGAAYPLVVAVLPDVPESHRRILVSKGCVVREVEPVYPPPPRYSMLRVWLVRPTSVWQVRPTVADFFSILNIF
jgi:hypothetical protein